MPGSTAKAARRPSVKKTAPTTPTAQAGPARSVRTPVVVAPVAPAAGSRSVASMNRPVNGPVNGSAAAHSSGRVATPAVAPAEGPAPTYEHVNAAHGTRSRVYVGDCREVLARLGEVRRGEVDLVFADPPFNWKRAYDRWDDDLPEREYLDFTFDWLDLCVGALRPHGAMWVNIPDTWAAEIVCYLKGRLGSDGGAGGKAWGRVPPHRMHMVNWCVWHYRFGQNTTGRFINSKVHALYFVRDPESRRWNPGEILEASDRASTYFDPRTRSKRDGMPPGLRVPLDVWYGRYWGRVQGNNSERRSYHDNQLPEVYLERVVRATSNEGDLVLDPFLGSGTTGVVAHHLGRHFIGTEFSPENARHASARIAAGPKRTLDGLRGHSTAIHPPRRVSGKARAS